MDEESLFAAALERVTAAERRAFLDEACAGDAALRQRVDRLLAAYEKTHGIVDQLARRPTSPEITAGLPPIALLTGEREGALVAGRYRLLEAVGEGGMGTVWKAEQTQPVRRTVAVKLIRAGMDSRAVLARFEAERQALALMDHPNIAKVHDGGTTESGRPFFVMEYVDGLPITQHCDNVRLTIAERLALFVPVCQAVQHAHAKGIIHRDLKPGNILVGIYDGQPVPKVIDFGLAKALHGPLTERTVHTTHGSMLGSPLYMSPEQAEFNNPDVDTRADVYALGVVLYELLTGTTPLERQRFRDAAWDEVIRLIKAEDPPRPSARLSGSDSLPSLAAQRRLEPARLTRLIRGELDWIIMKCLEKDRDRRYATANDLARDIERYLRDEPVEASPPGAGYRLRKFARRHRTALATVASFILLVLLGGVTSARLWRRAEVEKQRANEEASIARAVEDFLQKDLLGQADLANQAGDTPRDKDITVRQALDRAAKRIDHKFRGQELTEAAVRFTMGNAYHGLGEYPQAQRHLERSVDLRRQKWGAEHPDTLQSLHALAMVLRDRGRYREALPLLEKVVEGRRARLGADEPHTLEAMHHLGIVYRDLARYDEAESLYNRVLAAQRTRLGARHPDTLLTLNDVALMHLSRGRFKEAEPLLKEVVQGLRAENGPDHPFTLSSTHNLACCYMELDRYAAAEPLFRQVLKERLAKLGPRHHDTVFSMSMVALVLGARNRREEAEPVLRQVLEARRESLGPEHPDTLTSLGNLGELLRGLHKYGEAEDLLKQAVSGRRAKLGPEDPDTLRTMYFLGGLYTDMGRYDDAEPLYRGAVAGARKKLGLNHPQTRNYINSLADLFKAQGRSSLAEPMLRELANSLRDNGEPGSLVYADQLRRLSQNLLEQKKHVEAEAAGLAALKILSEKAPSALGTHHARSLLGGALLGQKKYAEAEPSLIGGYEGLKALGERIPAPTRGLLTAELGERIVQLYEAWGQPEKAAEWRTKLSRPGRPVPER
jgi:serine/threonine protein kinase/tetratricopeptide (TPR) repeat protein